MVVKSVGRVDMLGFMVWSSLFAVPPLMVLSFWLEGPSLMLSSVLQAGVGVWTCVLWQALGNTLFAYGAWNWLLARHPAATVTPLALLVPVFGMGASALSLGEPLPIWKLAAGTLVLCGLAVIVLWPRWRAALASDKF
jgi:O-acetylserine/cysteine efflux transporter